MTRNVVRVIALTVALIGATSASAGPYADDLSKCLVEKTTTADRTALVRWMFVAASRHPDVTELVVVTQSQLDESNAQMAAMVMKLLTESCQQETQKAVKYEGASTLETAFNVLGQVAGTELFGNADVAAAISGMQEHMDEEKLKALFESE